MSYLSYNLPMSYRDLKSYQQAVIIYDFTSEFCNRYIKPVNQSDLSNRSYRTADQMVQAARSGKQNIVEGSTERTSEKSELKLVGVARASFQELLEDYEDFLRQRGLKKWEKDDSLAMEVRNLYKTNQSNQTNRTNQTYMSYLENSEIAANAAICLIHQANFLLDRQIKSLEEEFIKEGGYSENLYWKREEQKKKEIIGRFWRKF